MADQLAAPLDPQALIRLLSGNAVPTSTPKQELPPEWARTGEQNPLVEALVGSGPHPDVKAMQTGGYSPHDIAVYQQMDKQRMAVEPPRALKEMAIAPIRPILDAGQYLGDAMRTGGASTSGPETLMHMLDVGSMFVPGPEALAGSVKTLPAIFAGIGARTADRAALSKALLAELKGGTPQDILAETGWFRGPNGAWRFEIPDNEMRVNPGYGHGVKFGVVQHPELAEAYPQLSNLEVQAHIDPNRSSGDYWPPNVSGTGHPKVSVTGDDRAELIRQIMAHELQHVIQGYEGWPSGAHVIGTKALANNRMLPTGKYTESQINDVGNALYYRNMGEVEARNTENRLEYTPAERQLWTPWSTEEVPPHAQLHGAWDEDLDRLLRELHHGNSVFDFYGTALDQESPIVSGGANIGPASAPSNARPWALTEAQKQDIAKRYAAGESTSSIADRYGIVNQLVSRHALARGAPPRKSGPVPEAGPLLKGQETWKNPRVREITDVDQLQMIENLLGHKVF